MNSLIKASTKNNIEVILSNIYILDMNIISYQNKNRSNGEPVTILIEDVICTPSELINRLIVLSNSSITLFTIMKTLIFEVHRAL